MCLKTRVSECVLLLFRDISVASLVFLSQLELILASKLCSSIRHRLGNTWWREFYSPNQSIQLIQLKSSATIVNNVHMSAQRMIGIIIVLIYNFKTNIVCQLFRREIWEHKLNIVYIYIPKTLLMCLLLIYDYCPWQPNLNYSLIDSVRIHS